MLFQENKIILLMAAISAIWSAALACAAAEPAPLDSAPYLKSAKTFADAVLEHGRDKYGAKQTPLFAEGLHVQTLEPAVWKWKGGEEWIISNFANQQQLMRLLDGMTGLTQDSKYRAAAEAAAAYMLENGTSVTGLIYWGGHTTWDLKEDRPAGTFSEKKGDGPIKQQRWQHELKGNQAHWELMWRVNPQATRNAMRAIWFHHIVDWKALDFNRHAATKGGPPTAWDPEWDKAFDEKIQVPYATKGGHLSFAGVVHPFLRAGLTLAKLDKDQTAFTWSRRMAELWHRNRDPKTGLGGGQISWREGHDRAKESLGHVIPDINESIIIATYHMTGRYFILPLAQMQIAEDFSRAGETQAAFGRQLIQWASEDLAAFGQRCWNSQDGTFTPMLTDGRMVNPADVKEGYYISGNFKPVFPNGMIFWGYATAYRLTKESQHWNMLRELGKRLGLGELGDVQGNGRALATQIKSRDWRLIYALIDLSRATGDKEFLRLAGRIGDNLIALQHKCGLFPRPPFESRKEGAVDHAFGDRDVSMPQRVYARTSDEIPLALLHLAAAIDGREQVLPLPVTDSQYFHCPYRGPLQDYQKKWKDTRTYDYLVFFGLTELD